MKDPLKLNLDEEAMQQAADVVESMISPIYASELKKCYSKDVRHAVLNDYKDQITKSMITALSGVPLSSAAQVDGLQTDNVDSSSAHDHGTLRSSTFERCSS